MNTYGDKTAGEVGCADAEPGAGQPLPVRTHRHEVRVHEHKRQHHLDAELLPRRLRRHHQRQRRWHPFLLGRVHAPAWKRHPANHNNISRKCCIHLHATNIQEY